MRPKDETINFNLHIKEKMFGDFNIHHKEWLTYSGGTDISGELCYKISVKIKYLKRPYSDG